MNRSSIDVAKAVVAALNDPANRTEFPAVPFAAKLVYFPAFTREEMEDLHVSVVPMTRRLDLAGRNTTNEVTPILHVAIQQGVADRNAADEIEPLIALSEAIQDFLVGLAVPGFRCTEATSLHASEEAFSLYQMESLNLFTYVIACVFQEAG
jgi:hypothetical protein